MNVDVDRLSSNKAFELYLSTKDKMIMRVPYM